MNDIPIFKFQTFIFETSIAVWESDFTKLENQEALFFVIQPCCKSIRFEQKIHINLACLYPVVLSATVNGMLL